MYMKIFLLHFFVFESGFEFEDCWRKENRRNFGKEKQIYCLDINVLNELENFQINVQLRDLTASAMICGKISLISSDSFFIQNSLRVFTFSVSNFQLIYSLSKCLRSSRRWNFWWNSEGTDAVVSENFKSIWVQLIFFSFPKVAKDFFSKFFNFFCVFYIK